MGVFFSVLDIELAVVAGCDNPASGTVGMPDTFEVLSRGVVPVDRIVDTYGSSSPGRIEPIAVYFSYINEHVLHAY